MKKILQISPTDNVGVAIFPLSAGETITLHKESFTLLEDIPAGHKVALEDFVSNDTVIKYAFPIGHTTGPIPKGSWVNERNIKTSLADLQDYQYTPSHLQPATPPQMPLTFQGYRRDNGAVAIRNEIWIIPTVGCVNGIVNELAASLREETHNKGIDAIVAFPHNYGCSQLGDDHENTRNILRDMVLHPHAGGVLVVGLGCENNQPEAFSKLLGEYDTRRIKFLVTQNVEDEQEEGMRLLRELYNQAIQDSRTELPLSELKVGLKCGGSDGFSGITANPLLGVFSDFLTAQGGTTVLSEVPEMFGAETLLMNRCQTEEVFLKTVHLINQFKAYFIANQQPIYENPSPGNKAGGISTLEEKSLGCTQKSGTSAVQDVLMYGERLTTPGLNLLSAPGNDLVASTALAASGCHLILFSTGRGTPFGTFVPTLKISTNSTLYHHKPGWIDFNAGTLLEGENRHDTHERFLRFILETINGQTTHNEKKGYREIAIFKTGVTL